MRRIFIYSDSVPAGPTAPRYATMIGTNGWAKQLGQLGCAACPGGDCSRCELGQIDVPTDPGLDADPSVPRPPGPMVPASGWPSLPWFGEAAETPTMPDVPGLVTEAEAAERERLAYERGRGEESARVWKTAAITAVVSTAVGLAAGRLFG